MDLWEDLSAEPYNFDKSKLISYMPEALSNEKGEMVALMADLTTCAVAYDRALAKQYFGTDDPDELAAMFATTQDYVDNGKKVTQESDGKVFTFASAQDAWGMLYAEVVDKPLVSGNKLDIDESIGDIFRFIEELQKNGSLNLYEQWSGEWVNNISDSTTLFYSCPLWFVEWGLVSNDSVGGGRWGIITPSNGATSGGEIFLIPKAAADDKKQAAYTFLEWLCGSKEGADALYESAGMISGYSGNLDEDSGLYDTSKEAYGGQNTDGVFLDVAKMDSTRIRPLTKYDSGISVVALDCGLYEEMDCVVKVAESVGCPVILMYYPGGLSAAMFSAIATDLAKRAKVDVSYILDHGPNYETAMDCVKAGFPSVMIDCSDKPFEENVRLVSEVVRTAHLFGVDVEAELGHVGEACNEEDYKDSSLFAKPDEVAEFVKRTGVDSLAVHIGSAHGIYKSTPSLDLKLLEEINHVTDVPLVLHGGSGIPMEQVQKAIKLGINKTNFGTEFDNRFADAMLETLQNRDRNLFTFELAPFYYEKVAGYLEKLMRATWDI